MGEAEAPGDLIPWGLFLCELAWWGSRAGGGWSIFPIELVDGDRGGIGAGRWVFDGVVGRDFDRKNRAGVG